MILTLRPNVSPDGQGVGPLISWFHGKRNVFWRFSSYLRAGDWITPGGNPSVKWRLLCRLTVSWFSVGFSIKRRSSFHDFMIFLMVFDRFVVWVPVVREDCRVLPIWWFSVGFSMFLTLCWSRVTCSPACVWLKVTRCRILVYVIVSWPGPYRRAPRVAWAAPLLPRGSSHGKAHKPLEKLIPLSWFHDFIYVIFIWDFHMNLFSCWWSNLMIRFDDQISYVIFIWNIIKFDHQIMKMVDFMFHDFIWGFHM